MPSGYIGWTLPDGSPLAFLLDRPWLAGRFYSSAFTEESPGSIKWESVPVQYILDTAAGTSVLELPYRGPKAPLGVSRRKIDIAMLAADQADYQALQLAMSVPGGSVYIPGTWETDSFEASAGQSYLLNRPIAAGIAPATTPDGLSLDAAHTALVYLDGVLTPGAATVAGQTVVAAASGLLSIFYMAAYTVAFTSLAEDWKSVNELIVTLAVQELRQGAFG